MIIPELDFKTWQIYDFYVESIVEYITSNQSYTNRIYLEFAYWNV